MLNNPVFQTTFQTNLKQQHRVPRQQNEPLFHQDFLTFQCQRYIVVFDKYINKIQ